MPIVQQALQAAYAARFTQSTPWSSMRIDGREQQEGS